MVYRAGDRAEEMYFVVRGVVRLERPAPAAAPNCVSMARAASLRPQESWGMDGSMDQAQATISDEAAAAAAAEQTESTIAGPGDAFGEAGLFADVGGAFQGETARVDSEEADIYVLPAGRMAELEGRYPAEMRRLRELCEMRAAETLVRAREAGAAPRPAEGSLAGCRCSSCGPPPPTGPGTVARSLCSPPVSPYVPPPRRLSLSPPSDQGSKSL